METEADEACMHASGSFHAWYVPDSFHTWCPDRLSHHSATGCKVGFFFFFEYPSIHPVCQCLFFSEDIQRIHAVSFCCWPEDESQRSNRRRTAQSWLPSAFSQSENDCCPFFHSRVQRFETADQETSTLHFKCIDCFCVFKTQQKSCHRL